MIAFGDFEPEDAWHPADPRPVLIANLYRRVALLDGGPPYRVRHDELAELEARLEAWRLADVWRSPRDEERWRQLLEDLIYVRSR